MEAAIAEIIAYLLQLGIAGVALIVLYRLYQEERAGHEVTRDKAQARETELQQKADAIRQEHLDDLRLWADLAARRGINPQALRPESDEELRAMMDNMKGEAKTRPVQSPRRE